MISQNHATAAAIAAKLTQTEGVEYSVVKETKGFRVVKTGKPKAEKVDALKTAVSNLQEAKKPFLKAHADLQAAIADVKQPTNEHTGTNAPKFTDTAVSPNNVIDPTPIGQKAQVLPFGNAFQVTCELRSETPTMIKAMIEGKPRAFEKKLLLGWGVELSHNGHPAVVTMKMSAEQAKKWKLK
jgi:hypothetical protein